MAQPIRHPVWPALGQAVAAAGSYGGGTQHAHQFQQNYMQIQGNPHAQSSVAAQQQAVNAFNQYMQQQQEQRRWMIDGQPMTFKQFADTLFPADTAERTMFYLKYSK